MGLENKSRADFVTQLSLSACEGSYQVPLVGRVGADLFNKLNLGSFLRFIKLVAS